MIENLFSYLSTALSGSISIAMVAAFGWGVLSILLSPCHLSSIPLVIGYISSQGQIKVKKSFYIALTFAIGILITITTIGIITASMGRLMGDVGSWGNWLVAIVFIIVGLYLMDLIRLDWGNLNLSGQKHNGIFGALLLGLIFGIGLGPCTFAFLAPVLGIVFHTASGNLEKAILLISAFGFGHCAIIVLAGSMTNLVQKYLDFSESSKTPIYLKRVAGVFVILGGLYFIYSSF
jgi:cytochrome c-type biogenesis protein